MQGVAKQSNAIWGFPISGRSRSDRADQKGYENESKSVQSNAVRGHLHRVVLIRRSELERREESRRATRGGAKQRGEGPPSPGRFDPGKAQRSAEQRTAQHRGAKQRGKGSLLPGRFDPAAPHRTAVTSKSGHRIAKQRGKPQGFPGRFDHPTERPQSLY